MVYKVRAANVAHVFIPAAVYIIIILYEFAYAALSRTKLNTTLLKRTHIISHAYYIIGGVCLILLLLLLSYVL